MPTSRHWQHGTRWQPKRRRAEKDFGKKGDGRVRSEGQGKRNGDGEGHRMQRLQPQHKLKHQQERQQHQRLKESSRKKVEGEGVARNSLVILPLYRHGFSASVLLSVFPFSGGSYGQRCAFHALDAPRCTQDPKILYARGGSATTFCVQRGVQAPRCTQVMVVALRTTSCVQRGHPLP